MSERNRRDRIAYFLRGYWSANPLSWWDINRVVLSITLQVVAIYLLVVSGLAILSGYDAKRETYRQEKDRAQTEQYQATRSIAGECAVPNAPPSLVAECLASEVNAYEHRKNTDQDLQAQQDMAYWGLMMFLASAAGVGVSMIGLWFLLQSLRQTKEAISIDRGIGHAQVRAYLSIDIPPPAFPPGKLPEISFKIVNTGQSPAYKVAYVAGILSLEHPLLDSQTDFVGVDPTSRVPAQTIGANGHILGDAKGEAPLTREQFEALKLGTPNRLYLIIRVFYTDVFDQPHETKLCAFTEVSAVKTTAKPEGTLWKIEWVLSHILNDAT